MADLCMSAEAHHETSHARQRLRRDWLFTYPYHTLLIRRISDSKKAPPSSSFWNANKMVAFHEPSFDSENLEWKCQRLSFVGLFVTPWNVARQAPLSLGILQAGILDWVASPFCRGSSWPRDWTWVSCIAGGFFTAPATWENLSHTVRKKLRAWALNDFMELPYLSWSLLFCTCFNQRIKFPDLYH